MSTRTYYPEQPAQPPLLPGFGVPCACGCGQEFQAHPGPGRPRRYVDNRHRARDFRSRAWASMARKVKAERDHATAGAVVHALGPWGPGGAGRPLRCTGAGATMAQVAACYGPAPDYAPAEVTCPACQPTG